MLQELVRCSIKNGPPQGFLPAEFTDQTLVDKSLDRIITLHAAHQFDFRLCDGLFIGNDGQGLHGGLREGLSLYRLEKPYDIFGIENPAGQLNMFSENMQIKPAKLQIIFVFQFSEGTSKCFHVHIQGLCQFLLQNGLTTDEKNGLNLPLQVFLRLRAGFPGFVFSFENQVLRHQCSPPTYPGRVRESA